MKGYRVYYEIANVAIKHHWRTLRLPGVTIGEMARDAALAAVDEAAKDGDPIGAMIERLEYFESAA